MRVLCAGVVLGTALGFSLDAVFFVVKGDWDRFVWMILLAVGLFVVARNQWSNL